MPPDVVLLKVTASDTLTAPLNVAPPELAIVNVLSAPVDPITALELITAAPDLSVKPLVEEACDANPEIAQDSSSLA